MGCLDHVVDDAVVDFAHEFVDNRVVEDEEDENALYVPIEVAVLFFVAGQLVVLTDLAKCVQKVFRLAVEEAWDFL